MTNEQKALLQLVSIANKTQIDFDAGGSHDWQQLFNIACQQGVSCLVFDGLQVLAEKVERKSLPQDFVLQMYARQMQTVKAMQDKKEVICKFASELLPRQGFVLKGLDYAQFWPNPLYREYGDFDCFYGNGYDFVNQKAADIGAKVEYSTHKHSHIHYKGLMIENHQTLTNFDGSRVGEQTEKTLMGLLNETSGLPLMDSCLLSPNPMFTVCFILKHAQQHFMTEGIELRHFLDWMYFVDKCNDKIDWERLNGLLDEMKLRNFAEMITAYCMTRLGWKPKCSVVSRKSSIVNSSLLDKVDDFVFSEKADVQNKRPIYRAKRILKRFVRAWHFRKLHYLPYHKAVWTWIVYASSLDRKPLKGLS